MIKINLSVRQCSLIGMVICIAVLISALVLQFSFGYEPCPLCILQRLVFFAAAILFFVGALLSVPGTLRQIYDGLVLLVVLVGDAIALWHVHLQHTHAQDIPGCGADLSFLFHNFPFSRAMSLVLQGTGDCTKVDVLILGLSIAEWSALIFLALTILCVSMVLRKSD
jgi:disulfide bond formation protein DsbB